MKAGVSTFRSHQAWLVLLVCLLFTGNIKASGDGPRVHAPVPVGMNALVLNGVSVQDANRAFDPSLVRPFSRFDTNILNILYMRTLAVKNLHVMLMGLLRGGET